MIREFVANLRKRAKEIAEAAYQRFLAAIRTSTPADLDAAVKALMVVASEGNVLNTEKRYRKTSGHAPHFSLYTFFANR
jgi:hypothetical protein